jgi:hypothetical protein
MISPEAVIGDNASNAAAFVVAPVPPFAIGKVPVTPVVNGKPVAFVNTPDAGVPNAGAVKVGEVKVLLVNVSVPARVAKVPEAAGKVIAVPVPATAGAEIVAVPDVDPAKATDVADATPKVGVTKVGEVAKTKAPEPDSLLITPANSDEVVAAKTLSLSVVYTPFVTVAALPEMEPTMVDENVLAPAMVCDVVKSTKFCVVEPVPPAVIGKVPEVIAVVLVVYKAPPLV